MSSRRLGAFGTAAFALVVGLVTAPSAHAQVEMFLSVTGIPGESTDPDHQGWIDVAGWGQGVSQPSITSPPPINFTPAVSFQPLKILKRLDKASPLLLLAAARGLGLTVRLELARTVVAKKATFFRIDLYNAIIGSVSSTSDTSSTAQELVTFYFARIQWTLTTFNADGTPAGTTQGFWDLIKGAGS